MALVEIRDVFKSYWLHGKRIDVLSGVSLDIEQGELVSLVGASGAGKSTFLHVLGTLDAPVAGSLRFDGRSVFDMSDAEVASFRNRTIGFVFQSHFLLPEFTALENVAMPALMQRMERTVALGEGPDAPGAGGAGRPAGAPARRALRRRGAAGGACSGARPASRHFCWRTSRPETSTQRREKAFTSCFGR